MRLVVDGETGLERAMSYRLLCDVRDQRFSPTTVVGAISAAATTGALIAIGHRMGDVGAPFAAIASVFVSGASRSRAIGGGAGAVLGGGVVQIVAMFVWSAICVRLADRIGSRVLAALVVAGANLVVSRLVLSSTGRGLASELTLGDAVIYTMVLTASLIVGMRYAFLHPRETATS
jgi:hypothetical protein